MLTDVSVGKENIEKVLIKSMYRMQNTILGYTIIIYLRTNSLQEITRWSYIIHKYMNVIQVTEHFCICSGSYDKYNDSEWHVVIATREHNQLRLDIDDFKTYR